MLTAVPNAGGSFGDDVFNRFMQVFNDELMADFYKDMCDYWLEKNLNSISTEYIDTKNSSYHNVKVGNVTFDFACEKQQAVYAYYDTTPGGKLTQKLWNEIENSTTRSTTRSTTSTIRNMTNTTNTTNTTRTEMMTDTTAAT